MPLPFSELSIEVFSQGAGYGCVQCFNPNCWLFLPVGHSACLQQFEVIGGIRRQSACLDIGPFDCAM